MGLTIDSKALNETDISVAHDRIYREAAADDGFFAGNP